MIWIYVIADGQDLLTVLRIRLTAEISVLKANGYLMSQKLQNDHRNIKIPDMLLPGNLEIDTWI